MNDPIEKYASPRKHYVNLTFIRYAARGTIAILVGDAHQICVCSQCVLCIKFNTRPHHC